MPQLTMVHSLSLLLVVKACPRSEMSWVTALEKILPDFVKSKWRRLEAGVLTLDKDDRKNVAWYQSQLTWKGSLDQAWYEIPKYAVGSKA